LVFSYDERSGAQTLKIEGDTFRHLFLSRRSKEDEVFLFRNLIDGVLYEYRVQAIGKKDAILTLNGQCSDADTDFVGCEIAWCVVDPKTIEKTLPMLNEVGVSKIYFIYSDRSQKNFKIDTDRLNRILISSCCQCGRTALMKTVTYKNLDEFCDMNIPFFAFDFGGEGIGSVRNGTFLIGPEGGFSERERELIKKRAQKILSFGAPNVLKSETAAVAAATLALI